VIIKAGKPVAEVKPFNANSMNSTAKKLRPFGLCAGEFYVPDNFNAPLPESIIAEFECR